LNINKLMKREILLGLMAGVISFTSCDVDLLDIPQQGVTNEEAFYKTDQDCEEGYCCRLSFVAYGFLRRS